MTGLPDPQIVEGDARLGYDRNMWRIWRAGLTKRVGKRQPCKGGLREANALLLTVVALRGQRRFIPRGLYRFTSFEEAAQWSIKMMARR